jgi:hypothetical protein
MHHILITSAVMFLKCENLEEISWGLLKLQVFNQCQLQNMFKGKDRGLNKTHRRGLM